MKVINYKIFILLFFFAVLSCGERVEEFDGFIPSEVEHLLSFSSSKDWLKVETRANGEVLRNSCNDSLIYVFTWSRQSGSASRRLFVATNPNTCSNTQFCAENPMICDAHENFCEDNEDFCDDPEFPVNLFFAGTWSVVAAQNATSPTKEFIINFPGDTTKYQINYITSEDLEVTYTDGDVEIFEKYTR